MDRDMFRSFDAKTDAISPNIEDGDFNLIREDDLLVFLATDNQHWDTPLL